MNTVSVSILGQTFNLRCDASSEEAQQVAEFVSRTMDELSRDRAIDTLNLAIMALLNVSGAYLRLQRETEAEEQQVTLRLRRCLDRLERAQSGNGSEATLLRD